MKLNRRPRRKMALLLAAFLLFAGVLGMLILRKYEMSRMMPSTPPQVQEAGTLMVTLFFSAPDGTGLMREAREIEACSEPATCAEEILDELINGPVGEMSPTLPPAAIVRSVTMEGDTAVVDLARESFEGLPGGSHSEMEAVYSMVDSIAFNFPRIKNVRFLLEGEKMVSPGHLDLRQPLAPDFTLEKKQ